MVRSCCGARKAEQPRPGDVSRTPALTAAVSLQGRVVTQVTFRNPALLPAQCVPRPARGVWGLPLGPGARRWTRAILYPP